MNKTDMVNVITCVQLYMDTLLETSSSSSEDEYMQQSEEHPTVDSFFKTVTSYSDADFKKNFKVNRTTAEYLTKRYSQSKYYNLRSLKGGRAQLSAKYEMFSFLWFATHKTTFREISNLFEMSVSTVQRLVSKILNFIVEYIAEESIVFPNSNDRQNVAQEFEKISGFPKVLGCIDACLITNQKAKPNIKSTYAYQCLSVTLQAICDANLKFLYIYTGVPSEIHDAFIGKQLWRKCLPNYHVLGAPAYPLREHLLTPYVDKGNLKEEEKLYNKQFYATSVKIQHAFMKLKGRFSKLLKLDFHNFEMMAKFVQACCALHNLCIENDDLLEDDDDDDQLVATTHQQTQLSHCFDHSDIRSLQMGQLKREKLKKIIWNAVNY